MGNGKNKIIDLFCGCGGLSLGFEEAGFEPVLAIDMWSDAIETYNSNRTEKIAKCIDIHDLTKQMLLDYKKDGVIGVIGGPPCQGFSTVGKRDINDPRNHLYLEYCRVVETLQPKFFVLENVKGLITLADGAFKEDIIKRFGDLGYIVKFKIVNAAHYGVPQNRDRVFFVGIKGHAFTFPPELDCLITSKQALSDLATPIDSDSPIKYCGVPQNSFQACMRGSQKEVLNHRITNHSEQTKDIIAKIPDGGSIKDLPKEFWEIRKYNKAFERMDSTRPSNTVDTGHRNYFHYKENRIPTVRENCRLQSIPDRFVIKGSKTSQYKQVGNAVPPLLAKAIAEAIADQI